MKECRYSPKMFKDIYGKRRRFNIVLIFFVVVATAAFAILRNKGLFMADVAPEDLPWVTRLLVLVAFGAIFFNIPYLLAEKGRAERSLLLFDGQALSYIYARSGGGILPGEYRYRQYGVKSITDVKETKSHIIIFGHIRCHTGIVKRGIGEDFGKPVDHVKIPKYFPALDSFIKEMRA